MTRSFWIKFGAAILIFGAGLFLGGAWKPAPALNLSQEVREGGYKFINPLLECETDPEAFALYKPFKNELQNYVDNINQQSDGVDFIAVYFRDLNNGPWISVNGDSDFSPASLLKVPVAITYFKMAEADLSVMNKKYIYDGNAPAVEQLIKPEQTLEKGKEYAVSDLVRRMITYSDNAAQHVLVQNVDLNILEKVYNDFGLPLPSAQNPSPTISVQTYASFFRILFNASYLTQDDSEELLSYLAQSDFNDGLVAGVPPGTVVAHKFGERETTGTSERQLHDCGIIYYGNHPYLLCVMTRGNDYGQLSGAIKSISNMVYAKISGQ